MAKSPRSFHHLINYKIKHTPGNKNDLADADWIAERCLNGMIEPPRIFPKRIDKIRKEIKSRIAYRKGDLKIAMSIPGVGLPQPPPPC